MKDHGFIMRPKSFGARPLGSQNMMAYGWPNILTQIYASVLLVETSGIQFPKGNKHVG